MGSAAYRRGSQGIREQLTRALRPEAFRLMEELNALGRYPDAGCPFGPIRIRHDASHDVWWFQDDVKGDAGFGFYYKSLREGCKRWYITIVAYDATTQIYQAIPNTEAAHSFENVSRRIFHPRKGT